MERFLHRRRQRTIEAEMLERLEQGIETLERVLPNAKQDLKGDHALVEAGKAKRVDGASIRHLNTHPQYLHAGESFCPVRPEKILSLFSVEAKDTYENRFLMTLIVRLSSFIEQRFAFALENPTTESLVLYRKEEKEGELYYRRQQESEDADMAYLALLRERSLTLLNSPFVKAMTPYGEVLSPIHPTNLLTKNPDYHACLEFFAYLEGKTELGVNYRYYEEEVPIDEKTAEALGKAMKALSSISCPPISEGSIKSEENPEVLFSLEEACFDDGKVLFSFFPDLTPIDPKAIPLEEASRTRKRMERLIERQKKTKPLVGEKVLEKKDAIVLESIAKRKEKRP